MQNKKSTIKSYNSLLWLLFTEYTKDGGYIPSSYLVDSFSNRVSHINTSLDILDSTKYNLTTVSGFKTYFNLFLNKIKTLENPLVVLSYTKEKYIVRDYSIANLIKLHTFLDIAYIDCENPEKVTTTIFDYVIPFAEVSDTFTSLINKKNDK